MKPLIPILLLIGLTARAADPSLAALPKMTAAEAEETVLNEGVIVRIINTEPADVRVGDGETLGGVRIGDASGWVEGTALTQDLEVGSHKINLGNWSIRTLGGWTAISGGTTSTDSGAYQVSISGSVMLQMLGANSLTEISRFAYDGTYFQLDTALGDLPAVIESSPSLISPDWAAATVHHCTTNNGIITHFIDPDQYDAYTFFRAAVTTGAGAYADFNAEIRQYGEPVALQSDLDAVSNDISAVSKYSNLTSLRAVNAFDLRNDSEANAKIQYEDYASTIELFTDLTAWNRPNPTNLQVLGGAVYADTGGVSGGLAGANMAFEVDTNEFMRAVFQLDLTNKSGGGIIVGVSHDAVGAPPASGASKVHGIYFQVSAGRYPLRWEGHIDGEISDVTTTTYPGIWTVTITADQDVVACAATQSTNLEIRTEWDRSEVDINNLYIFNSCTELTNGPCILSVGARKSGGSISPRNEIEDVGYTVDLTTKGDESYKLTLPPYYDSRKPTPLCVMFHGNGSDVNHFADNINGNRARQGFLNAGFAVLTACYNPNKATWGAQKSLDTYEHAYLWALQRYNLGTVVYYSNSMGGIESLLSLAQGKIPGVAAWCGTVPACSLYGNYISGYSGVTFAGTIRSAYGIAADGSDYAEKTADHDPNLLDPRLFGGTPMYWVVATDDTAVEPAYNADIFIPRIAPYVEELVRVNTTGNHSGFSSELPAMMTWLNEKIIK